ncbi:MULTISPECIES: bifunctional folylpolyglutamate synthase/dihydrofolate synthase [Bacillaceae]|uniref:bifunctional folylpolyglutamate synthase/dihydrofolate synthase n=1 Tax=Bacillaceae TaxID=186817 RepID=UPI000BFBCBB2|nr:MULTISPECIES: folylpolyglutamate synthase/dihydrofolate synthase family protein [Bacillaceae]PGT88153.1 bifunctional folylpolyglutamate synthase/dihydrofolate synthase [Bacillus sp. AFS040349]UGB29697.1 bifunctional folylpolyglutamate synthase/dihydrofolate synthase [Metabacillus sp. B2-18]
MFNRYEDAVDWIHGRLKFGVKPGLKRMEWLLKELGHPEMNIPTIHVAGTNGKGSTISYMLHILKEADYKVGTFTSPYIETFNERISVNGEPISDVDMLNLVNEVKPFVEKIEQTDLGGPTEFEIITTMMFLYFGKLNQPDILLLETGLGGRLDSTNIINPLLSIITNVGYDHMNILGNTITEIASEKAGIIKQNVPVLTAVEKDEALQVIKNKAKQLDAESLSVGSEIHILEHSTYERGEIFTVETEGYFFENLKIQMRGQHQTKNAALAVSALHYLRESNKLTISDDQIYKGLLRATWKGRFEQVNSNPVIIVDGAHNHEGIESLIETITSHYSDKNIHILFSALKDKEYEEMIDRLSSIAATMHFTTFDFPRAEVAEKLYSACKHEEKSYSESWKEMLDQLLHLFQGEKEDIIIVTGSLYFISEIRSYLIKKNHNKGT